MEKAKRAVSMAEEVGGLQAVIEAAARVADDLVTNSFPTETARTAAPQHLRAVLTLAAQRLRLLVAVLQGEVSPAIILHDGNDAPTAIADGEAEDVRLPQWSPNVALGHARADVARLELATRRRKKS